MPPEKLIPANFYVNDADEFIKDAQTYLNKYIPHLYSELNRWFIKKCTDTNPKTNVYCHLSIPSLDAEMLTAQYNIAILPVTSSTPEITFLTLNRMETADIRCTVSKNILNGLAVAKKI